MTATRTGRAAALAGAVALAALSDDARPQEVRIGAMADMTGAYSHVGTKIQEAQRLAARQINAQGGMFAAERELVLVEGDGGCAAEPAAAAAREILSDPGVVSIIGPTCSGATLAAAREAAIPAGRAVVSHSATAPAITELDDDDLVFRMPPSDAYLSVALSGMVHNRYIRRVAVTHAADDYNAGVGQAFLDEYEANGGEVVAFAEHAAGETDYDALIDSLAVPEAEALVIFAYYDASGADIVNAARADGRLDIFIGADGMVNDGLIEQVGASNLDQALFLIAAADDSAPAYRRWEAAAREAGLDPAVPFTPHGYDAAFVTALAIEWMGEADPAGMPEALRAVGNAPGVPILPGEWAKAKALLAEGREIDYAGASGEVAFDANGDTTGLFSVNTVNADGTWNVQVLR